MNYLLDFPFHTFQEFLRSWLFEAPYSWMKHFRHSSSYYQKLDHWIMQFKSFHDLAIIGYGSLYHVHTWRRVTPEAYLYIVTFRLFLQNKVGRIYVYMSWRVFDSIIIPLALVEYEMIANSALWASLVIYHRISNKCECKNCLMKVW